MVIFSLFHYYCFFFVTGGYSQSFVGFFIKEKCVNIQVERTQTKDIMRHLVDETIILKYNNPTK